MAKITATPNPVGVYSVAVGGKATIEWDTEAGSGGTTVNGKVSVLENGVFVEDLPNPAPTGKQDYKKFFFPKNYTLILKDAATDAELKRVDVATYDLRSELIGGFSSPYVPAFRPQMITNVSIKPGVDTVRISFKTVRPTIPLTTLMDASGTKLDARFPLFGGLRTDHEAIFGVETPLELETKHLIRIVAAGPTGNKTSPKEAVFNAEFMSGSRKLEVFFDSVNVHDDGDPGPSGSGELAFRFGAGDAETAAPLGEPWPDYGPDDISYDDPPVAMNKQLSIPKGPRQLWVEVVAVENDRTAWPWDWGSALGTRPTFTGAGSSYAATAAVEVSSTCSVFDIGSDPDSWSMAFDMATGDFPVDYVVSGRIVAELAAGAVIAPKSLKPRPRPKAVGTLEDAGTTAFVATQGAIGKVDAFVRGPDGALHHQRMTRDAKRDADWNRIELPGEGIVTAMGSASDTIDLLFLDGDGSVSHRSFNPKKPKDQKWRRLGGNFRQLVPAGSSGKDGALHLFGVEEDGSLHGRDAAKGNDWDRIGDQAVSAIAPVDGSAALFAVATDGTLLHVARQKGRWKSQAMARFSDKVPTVLLTVASFDRHSDNGKIVGHDLVIGALGEDHSVRILRWPDYPRGESDGTWEKLGSVQDLLIDDSKRRRPKAKAK